jgi:hypothetical protein
MSTVDPKYSVRRYWPVPNVTQSLFTYQNVNADKNLQNNVTKFFYKKLLNWIQDQESKFNKFKYLLKDLESENLFKLIYKLLRNLIKITNINWYDLRDNYLLIKKYIYIKLKQLK